MATPSEDFLGATPLPSPTAGGTLTDTSGTPRNDQLDDQSQSKAEMAKQQTAEVAQSALSGGKDIVHEAADQVSVVATDVKEQVSAVVGQVKDEVKTQLDSRSQQAAEGLRTLSTQLSSLAQGRPEESGRVGELVSEAQQRLQTYADTLQQRGPQALVDDVSAFARRRPLVFLAAATMGGFAFGRLVRGGAEANKQSAASSRGSGNGTYASNQLPRSQDRTQFASTSPAFASTALSAQP